MKPEPLKNKIEEISSKHKWKLNQSEKSEAIASTFARYIGVNKIHEMHNDEIDKLKKEVLKEIQKRVQGLLEEIEKDNKNMEKEKEVGHKERRAYFRGWYDAQKWCIQKIKKWFGGVVKKGGES